MSERASERKRETNTFGKSRGKNVLKCKRLVGQLKFNKFDLMKLSFRILGKWINCFRKGINQFEKNNYSVLGQIARINDGIKHADGSWFTAIGIY